MLRGHMRSLFEAHTKHQLADNPVFNALVHDTECLDTLSNRLRAITQNAAHAANSIADGCEEGVAPEHKELVRDALLRVKLLELQKPKSPYEIVKGRTLSTQPMPSATLLFCINKRKRVAAIEAPSPPILFDAQEQELMEPIKNWEEEFTKNERRTGPKVHCTSIGK